MNETTPVVSHVRDRIPLGLCLLLAFSFAFNVFLGISYFRTSYRARPSDSALSVGTVVPPVVAKSLSGAPDTVSFGQGEENTLLYFFATGCPACQSNASRMTAIGAISRQDLRVIGLAMDANPEAVEKYVREQRWTFKVLIRPSIATIKAYQVQSVPSTVLVSKAGHVVRAWYGPFVDSVGEDVSATLRVTLP